MRLERHDQHCLWLGQASWEPGLDALSSGHLPCPLFLSALSSLPSPASFSSSPQSRAVSPEFCGEHENHAVK